MSIVELILAQGERVESDLVSDTMETTVILAAANQYVDIVRVLLEAAGDKKRALVNKFTTTGSTALHISVQRKNMELIAMLLAAGADPSVAKRDGSTPLHVAAVVDAHETVAPLLASGANMELDRFGCNPLHTACIKGHVATVRALLTLRPALIDTPDGDGSTPIHLACNVTKDEDISRAAQVIRALITYGADVNCVDGGGATPLHVLAAVGDRGVAIAALLLENGARPTIENSCGWTPLHHAANNQSPAMMDVLREWCERHEPVFLSTFDAAKPRATRVNRDTLVLESGPDRIARIATDIRERRITRIVILSGAGISVSAGIPAYRTSDGLLTTTRFQFSMDSITNDPDTFFDGIRQYFLPAINGKIKPTRSHEFLGSLASHGLLQRNFTQNVDMLEQAADVPSDLVVHSHGSLANWYCSGCRQPADSEAVWREIGRGGQPYCTVPACRAVIRPDVVFFGEGLPVRFHQQAILDMRQADLLIVMGTSLSVYPFAGLVNDVGGSIPRILINKDPVGPFRGVSDIDRDVSSQQQLIIESRGSRDVVLLGECDQGVDYLSKLIFDQ
eukprot:gene11945-13920_t